MKLCEFMYIKYFPNTLTYKVLYREHNKIPDKRYGMIWYFRKSTGVEECVLLHKEIISVKTKGMRHWFGFGLAF